MDLRWRELRGRDWWTSAAILAVFVAVITVSAFVLLPRRWWAWLAVVAASTLALVVWHARTSAYRCSHCGAVFQVSVLVDLVSPHTANRRGARHWLRCPECRTRAWHHQVVVER